MCRFLGYAGESLALATLLQSASNSLIAQSRSQKGSGTVHADGCGLCWYNPVLGENPAVYRSIKPVWNDSNLHHIIQKTQSKVFVGHIRAATVGTLSELNCHPFHYGRYAFVHNGTVDHFAKIKRALLNQLPEHLFLAIQGTTDSECLFYLILSFLEKPHTTMDQAVYQAIWWVEQQLKLDTSQCQARLNMLITDGQHIVASRVTLGRHAGLSLFIGQTPGKTGVIVSSEIVGFPKKNWKEIPRQSLVVVRSNHQKWLSYPYLSS